MKLRYETGSATLMQFAVVTIFAFTTQFSSVVAECVKHNGNCVGDTLTSFIYVILVGVWLGFVSVIGYTVQDKRNRRMAQLLIACEGMVGLIALFNARHFPNFFGLVASLVDLGFAVLVIYLAWNVLRAGGGRIVASSALASRNRPRRRPTASRSRPQKKS
jgi:hypothetical protein